ncbi:MAG: hypothetical protein K0S57_4187 [Ramlibacter sp.]|nr:hypothetical protein [Ramlibacter sp.]
MEKMRRGTWGAVALALCALMAGCATSLSQPMGAENLGRMQTVRVRVLVPQAGFLVSASAPGVSAAMGGGLIPAMIDAGIQKSRQKDLVAQAAPTLDKLLEVDVRREFTDVAARELQQFPFKVAKLDATPLVPVAREHEATLKELGTSDGYLAIVMHYDFDMKTRIFSTRSQVNLWQAGATARTYFAPIMYRGRPVEPGTDLPAAIREQARESASHTLKLALLGMKGMPPPATSTQFELSKDSPPLVLQGDVVGKETGRVFVRHVNGALFSIPN